MDIISTKCDPCIDKGSNICYDCRYFLLNKIKEQFKNKGNIDITTTSTNYHFNQENAKMKVSQNLLIVDIVENNIETPIFFHKNQIIEVN